MVQHQKEGIFSLRYCLLVPSQAYFFSEILHAVEKGHKTNNRKIAQ